MRYLRLIPAGLLVLFLMATAHAQFLGGVPLPFANKASGSTSNSLTFTSGSNQYLTATGKVSASAQKFSIPAWFKLPNTSSIYGVYGGGDGTSSNYFLIRFNSGGALQISSNLSGSGVLVLASSASVVPDANWHHLLVAVDTTQATAANRVLPYIDGTVLSSFSVSTYPTQNTNLPVNLAHTYYIGSYNSGAGQAAPLNGNLAQVYYIDGQQLTPSSFITGTPGVPKTYSGTYTGTFDFFLPFSNGTSTTTLGADSSGESNNWTLNNMTTANQSSDFP